MIYILKARTLEFSFSFLSISLSRVVSCIIYQNYEFTLSPRKDTRGNPVVQYTLDFQQGSNTVQRNGRFE